MKRTQSKDYWCIAQNNGPTLYFHGDDPISRSDYVHAVGAADCDPHITTGRAASIKKAKPKKRAAARDDAA